MSRLLGMLLNLNMKTKQTIARSKWVELHRRHRKHTFQSFCKPGLDQWPFSESANRTVLVLPQWLKSLYGKPASMQTL